VGPFGVVIAMLETADFFQKQAQECRSLAAWARDKNDKEYWLRLAQRWEWLMQQSAGPKLESVRPLRTGQSVLQKRIARWRAA
jgi:hypothetical protein